MNNINILEKLQFCLNKTNIHVLCSAEHYDFNTHYSITDKVLALFDDIYLMPDTHIGKSVPVGFVAKYDNKIIPDIVGVDIGCGMGVYPIEKRKINFKKLQQFIVDNIPSGREIHKYQKTWKPIDNLTFYPDGYDRALKSLGTLGGGNHFIEIVEGLDNYFIIIHSGSRILGKDICEYHTRVMKGKPYLEGLELENYIIDMSIAQEYAVENRTRMMKKLLDYFDENFNPAKFIDVQHNYVDLVNKVIHKGSISAKNNEVVIIPLNMRDGVIIGRGKGNAYWANSAPHGAGRKLSRSQAQSKITLKQYEQAMKSVNTFSVCKGTLDESPFAYKDSSVIIEAIQDTVTIEEHCKPIFNFKASK